MLGVCVGGGVCVVSDKFECVDIQFFVSVVCFTLA